MDGLLVLLVLVLLWMPLRVLGMIRRVVRRSGQIERYQQNHHDGIQVPTDTKPSGGGHSYRSHGSFARSLARSNLYLKYRESMTYIPIENEQNGGQREDNEMEMKRSCQRFVEG
jgi:hypothetical protein